MVERTIDKKIRVLHALLDTAANEQSSKDAKQSTQLLSTESLGVPYASLVAYLTQFRLTQSNKVEDPFSNQINEYLVDVVVGKNDVDRLLPLLKEYEANFPKRKKPSIREKTLELIARQMGDIDTGYNLIKFLKGCGVDEELIVYPNTKWRMIFDVLCYLSLSANKKDQEVLFKVIGEATHPLMHGGDKAKAEELRKKFNELLAYENAGIGYAKGEGAYLVAQNMSEEEVRMEAEDAEAQSDDYINHLEQEAEKELAKLSTQENKEKISLLRKSYQSLINVLSAFCENPSTPSLELNNSYQFLYRLINKTISELGLWTTATDNTPFARNSHFFTLPFSNLFSAEKTYQEQGTILSWQKIRPELNAMYGDIEEMYNEVNGNDVLAEPDKQEKLNDIQLMLSTLKKKRELARKMVESKRARATTAASKTTVEVLHKYEDKKPRQEVKSLKNAVIRFDDNAPALFIDQVKIALPEFKKEHYFVRAMLKWKKDEPIDWSVIYKDMESRNQDEPIPDKANWRYVYDAANDVNNRIQEKLGTTEKLFIWSEKTVKRLY